MTAVSKASAVGIARAIAAGQTTAREHVTHCLTSIRSTDAQFQAWAQVDGDAALARATTLDSGMHQGPLHGLAVGVKDVIDTRDMPTEWGSTVCAGRRPATDAVVVGRLRAAGAVILGKTVTTEFAYLDKAATRNPHNPAFSPGGSSSGSAAAVAAGHVPLAVGTQTGGSVIRPAAFCGVYGLKPSVGSISREGVLQTSQTLDHVGVFAGTLGDLGLISEVLRPLPLHLPLVYFESCARQQSVGAPILPPPPPNPRGPLFRGAKGTGRNEMGGGGAVQPPHFSTIMDPPPPTLALALTVPFIFHTNLHRPSFPLLSELPCL